MATQSNPQVIPKTLADLIREEIERDQQVNNPPVSQHNDYEVWPEDQGDADHKRNPYSRA